MLAVLVVKLSNTNITELNTNVSTLERNHLNVNGVASVLLTQAHTVNIGTRHGAKMLKGVTERRKNQEVKVWMLKRKDQHLLVQKLLQVIISSVFFCFQLDKMYMWKFE